jgi:hypothetical protein
VLGAARHINLRSALDVGQFFRLPGTGFLLYRPVSTTLYFYLLRLCFGYDPVAYHATQIGFHIINALLVYAIADSLFFSRGLALASALVYASAPGHAIAACWIALFTMTGTAFFYLLALWVWLRLDSRWRVPLTFVLFVVALLASEHAVSLPLVLTLAAILLQPGRGWRRCVREQAAFYAIACGYVGLKLYFFHYLLSDTFPRPAVQAYVLSGYGVSLEPLSILRHLGHYVGFAIDLAYAAVESDTWALAAGVLIVALAVVATGCVAAGRWTARSLRVAAFGLDLFIVALGPVLVLPRHMFSYYVGIAAAGMALALIGFAHAFRGARRVAPSLIVGATLAMHGFSTATVVRQSQEFQFFSNFSRSASRWLYTLAVEAPPHGVEEVVVPLNQLTALVFGAAEAHKLFLCAPYRVTTAPAIDEVKPATGRLILRRPLPLPRSDTAGWLRHSCSP